MKKTISLILALALIVSMLPSAAFAADSPSASLSVDKTSIKAGEEITVTVNLDTAIENVMLAEFYVHYDTSLFTRGEATVGTALTGTQVSTKNVATDGKELKMTAPTPLSRNSPSTPSPIPPATPEPPAPSQPLPLPPRKTPLPVQPPISSWNTT